MSITHTNTPVNHQTSLNWLDIPLCWQTLKSRVDPKDARRALLSGMVCVIACCLSLGLLSPVVLAYGTMGGLLVTKTAEQNGGGYFAYPIGLSDWTYLDKMPLPNGQNSAFQPSPKAKFNPLKHLTEVRGIEVFASTVIAKRGTTLGVEAGKRREVLNLSAKSLARLAFIAFNTPAYFPSMLTLTYPAKFSNDGERVKMDLDAFLRWYRYHFPGALYLWFLEFQKRGAPHFHVLSTVDLAHYGVLATVRRKKQGKVETWQTHWETWQRQQEAWRELGGGHTAWEVINDAEGGKKYAAKYATKAYQKAVPPAYRNVGRFWGHSREGVKPEPEGCYECNEAQLRAALERGGWEHLPDDGGMLFRELYQAAKAIDLSQLTPVETLDKPKLDPARPVLSAELTRLAGPSVYVCESCGGVSGKWAGQCPACGEWDTLNLNGPTRRF